MRKTNEVKIYKLIILAASGGFAATVLSYLKLILELPEKNILTLIGIPLMFTPSIIALFIYYIKIRKVRRRLSYIILAIAILLIAITSIIYYSYITKFYL